MDLFKTKKKYPDINYLELTPVRVYNFETDEKGLIDVLIPKFRNKLAVKVIVPTMRQPNIKINLDEFGSSVWKLIDGNTKVKLIIENLILEFGDRIEPAQDRILLFLTQLYKNKFINFLELTKG